MGFTEKLTELFRGEVSLKSLPREAIRRRRAAARRRIERRNLGAIDVSSARLTSSFESLSAGERLAHFRSRKRLVFAPDISLKPSNSELILRAADAIVTKRQWELAGFGPLHFGEEIAWRRDPLGDKDWGLDYHADVVTFSGDGADIRVLWELNRFGQAVTLAAAYELSGEERFAETFFEHVSTWTQQNPYGRGANWVSPMEVALRSINLLAAFELLDTSRACTTDVLAMMLRLFDQHAGFIADNIEFSFISTSNHYLSNLAGLFWIGSMMPELKFAAQWREHGWTNLIAELDKQILPDGTDYEASTGYHKFVTELVLYSVILAERTGDEIDASTREKIHAMLRYLKTLIRPDGRMPLVGDADGSQIIPILRRDADDAAYLLSLGAAFLKRPDLAAEAADLEVAMIFGADGVVNSRENTTDSQLSSAAFPDSGVYILRDRDLYLLFSAGGVGINGRGSHAHNDALGIEISAFGKSFIVDPGSYVYNLDRGERHKFRSTGFHSTVLIDETEQRRIDAEKPFVIRDEARTQHLKWETGETSDFVAAEHRGYEKLADPVRHRRDIEFRKVGRAWIIDDFLRGKAEHTFSFRFHVATRMTVTFLHDNLAKIVADDGDALLIGMGGLHTTPTVEPSFVSRNYGNRESASILNWTVTRWAPLRAKFVLVPVAAGENEDRRLELIQTLTDNV